MVVNRPPFFCIMIKITYAKTNNDGSITVRAEYNDVTNNGQRFGISKLFITKQPISTDPSLIDHTDTTLVVYYQSFASSPSIDVTIES